MQIQQFCSSCGATVGRGMRCHLIQCQEGKEEYYEGAHVPQSRAGAEKGG